jgi:beta-fructofuranosidase
MTEPDTTKLKLDPHRPVYHFVSEANWLNDPNGLIQWCGRYHLFYQYNPNGAFHGTIHWGHAVSEDLVNWKHLPIALAPTPDSSDQDGCFSGCAVDNGGVATLIYTGVRGDDQLACVATTTDDLLIKWEKYAGNPVIAAPPAELKLVAYRDHSVWKEGDTWYQVIGAGIEGVGGTALLYRSPDLLTWEYLNPIFSGDRSNREPFVTGDMWECPTLFALNAKHVLIVSVWENHQLHYCVYFTGDFDGQQFTPQYSAIMDNGASYYACQTMLDEQGRRLVWGWLREQTGVEVQRLAGWSGVMSLPRVLTVLGDGRLAQAPVPELAKLRADHRQYTSQNIKAGIGEEIAGIQGDALEIILELEPGEAESAGIAVGCSPDGAEQTLILYDWRLGGLVIDRKLSSLTPDVPHDQRFAACPPSANGSVNLHVFLDRSVIEVFVNHEIAMACRIYPTRSDSLGLRLVANGGQAILRLMDLWTIQPIEY